MSSNSDADNFVLLAKAVFDSALKLEYLDAIILESLSSTPSKPAINLTQEEFNKYMILVFKYVVDVVAATPTGVLSIKSIRSGVVLDFMVKAVGVKIPEEGTDINSLKIILSHLNDDREDIKKHVSWGQIERIRELANATASIWQNLRRAIEQGDDGMFSDEIKKIRSYEVEPKLVRMRSESEGNDGLALSLQRMYKNRLEDPGSNMTFDARTYLLRVNEWNDLVSDVDRMTTALLVLKDAGIPLLQKRRQEDSAKFLADMRSVFLGDIGLWPSTKALAEAAAVNKGEQFPHVFELESDGTPMYIGSEPISSVSAFSSGYYEYPLSVDESTPSMLVIRAFALERLDGLWRIRGNRPIQESSACHFFGRWEALKDSDDGPYIPYIKEQGNDSLFKIIPLHDETEYRVKLLWRDPHDKSQVKETISPIILKRTNIPYPVFGDPPEVDQNRFRDFIYKKDSAQKFTCDITNQTSDRVLVLDDAFANDNYHYSNTVWLPGERWLVGGWGDGIRACFRFGVYK
ncbi:hypothetical protein FRC01_006069, partial [Tulasnella sp. 417]